MMYPVVEVYQDWCGPCKAVITSLKRQFFELGERPLKFYTVTSVLQQGLLVA